VLFYTWAERPPFFFAGEGFFPLDGFVSLPRPLIVHAFQFRRFFFPFEIPELPFGFPRTLVLLPQPYFTHRCYYEIDRQGSRHLHAAGGSPPSVFSGFHPFPPGGFFGFFSPRVIPETSANSSPMATDTDAWSARGPPPYC